VAFDMLQTTSVSFAKILVNSNRPTWSRIAQYCISVAVQTPDP